MEAVAGSGFAARHESGFTDNNHQETAECAGRYPPTTLIKETEDVAI
jgi:hypothetical protein